MGDIKFLFLRVLFKRQCMVLIQNDERLMYSILSLSLSLLDEDFQILRRKWMLKKLEMFGLCYDLQFFDVLLLMGESSNYKYFFEEDRRKVVELLVD